MEVRSFGHVVEMAAARHGGIAGLRDRLVQTPVRSAAEISATSDDRILALMTRRVFCAGFSSAVIDGKWPAFETAFRGFAPIACALLDESGLEALLRDTGIVRNAVKIRSVQRNAAWLVELKQAHGSAAHFFAQWPDRDYIGLLDVMKKQGSRLGGDTGMRFLRAFGKPSFILTRDVVAALKREGVIRHDPSGNRDLATIQLAFNDWSVASGRDMTEISQILALSVG